MAMTACSAKVFQERDLRVGEASGLAAHDADHPDGVAVPEQRHAERAAPAARPGEARRVLGIVEDIWNMSNGTAENGSTR